MGLNKAEKFIPGARWLRGYTVQFAVSDFIAGITVGLTVLPQGLAYATLAGLEPQVRRNHGHFFEFKLIFNVIFSSTAFIRHLSEEWCTHFWEDAER